MLSERETPCVGGEFEYGDREGMSDRDQESKQESLTGTKVFHPNSHFYPAFLHLTSHFPHKLALMDARIPRHSEKPFFRGLSRKLSFLQRHELPSVGVQYNSLDGSANLEDVTKHLLPLHHCHLKMANGKCFCLKQCLGVIGRGEFWPLRVMDSQCFCLLVIGQYLKLDFSFI